MRLHEKTKIASEGEIRLYTLENTGKRRTLLTVSQGDKPIDRRRQQDVTACSDDSDEDMALKRVGIGQSMKQRARSSRCLESDPNVSEKEDAIFLRCCQRLDYCHFKDMAYLDKRILFLAHPPVPNVHNHTCFRASTSPPNCTDLSQFPRPFSFVGCRCKEEDKQMLAARKRETMEYHGSRVLVLKQIR